MKLNGNVHNHDTIEDGTMCDSLKLKHYKKVVSNLFQIEFNNNNGLWTEYI